MNVKRSAVYHEVVLAFDSVSGSVNLIFAAFYLESVFGINTAGIVTVHNELAGSC